jgi:tRNA (guanine37-N1)-methyltransferase
MFTIDVVTLFPEFFAPFVGLSIVGRAVERNLASVRYHHLLDELDDGERADDAPFGGGAGMVLRIEPIARVLDRIASEAPSEERRAIVVPSPSGRPFNHAEAARWAKLDRLVIICGHYEGIDDRLGRLFPIQEWSLGDFVLTGGEIPALAFLDATVRLVVGAVRAESLANESFANGMLYASRQLPGRRRAGGAAFGRPRQNRAVAARAVAPSHRGTAEGPARGARRYLARRGRPVIPYGGCAGPRARLFVAPASTEFTPSASTALSTGSVRGTQDLRV